jgi:protein ImuB
MARSDLPQTAAEKHRQAVQQIITILHKWGIHTLGQLTTIDKEQLGARLGPEAIRMWERANGQSKRLLKLVRPPESFEESFEFENEIETAEPLLFMLRRFLEQLAVRLGAIYLVAKELSLRITFANPPKDGSAEADKQVYERVFKIPQPTNDVDLLFRMLQTHLENFKSEYPIVAVALSAYPSRPAREQFGLFETTLRNPHQLSETLARLTALLGGADRVGTPVLEETHRPDAFHMEPFTWQSSTGFQPVGQAGVLACDRIGRQDARRPHSQDGCAPLSLALRRFRPAVSASILLDEDISAHVRSAEIREKVIEQHGPYLLSGNWWDEKSWIRAEWDLQMENGELLRAHETDPPSQSYGVAGGTWKIEGIYD